MNDYPEVQKCYIGSKYPTMIIVHENDVWPISADLAAFNVCMPKGSFQLVSKFEPLEFSKVTFSKEVFREMNFGFSFKL